MNNLSSDKIINALPIRIVQGLESALSLLPDSDTAIIEKPESEGAFNHILFVTTATEMFQRSCVGTFFYYTPPTPSTGRERTRPVISTSVGWVERLRQN